MIWIRHTIVLNPEQPNTHHRGKDVQHGQNWLPGFLEEKPHIVSFLQFVVALRCSKLQQVQVCCIERHFCTNAAHHALDTVCCSDLQCVGNSLVALLEALCDTYECVMSHIQIRHITHTDASLLNMKESCHAHSVSRMWISHMVAWCLIAMPYI